MEVNAAGLNVIRRLLFCTEESAILDALTCVYITFVILRQK